MATVTVPRREPGRHVLLLVLVTIALGAGIAAIATWWGDDDGGTGTTEITNGLVLFPRDGRTFDDAVALTGSFVDEVLAVPGAVVGELATTSSGRGTVPVTTPSGDAVTVDVAHLDSGWVALGAQGAQVTVSAPVAGTIVPSPAVVEGQATAAGGMISVVLLPEGSTTPIAETTATVGVAQPTPYTVTLPFQTPSAYWGAVVIRALDIDGNVVDAAAVPVGF